MSKVLLRRGKEARNGQTGCLSDEVTALGRTSLVARQIIFPSFPSLTPLSINLSFLLLTRPTPLSQDQLLRCRTEETEDGAGERNLKPPLQLYES